jgi:type III secretory pathway component EscR
MQIVKNSFYLILLLLTTACANVRKVQVIQNALAVKDVPDSAALAEKARLDSVLMVKGIVNNIANTKIRFNTMNAKLKMDYETSKNKDSYIANLSIQKDSCMYITIRGAMGVIGLKAFINKDSIVLIFPLSKKTEKHPLSYLQEVIKIPLNYHTIEDLVIGNPIFMDSIDIISYKVMNERLQVSLMGKLFKNLIILSEDNTKLIQLKLDDVDVTKHRTCDINYSQHTLVKNTQFPLFRTISINAQTKLDIGMEIKEFSFDEPLKYTFTIPKTGRRK